MQMLALALLALALLVYMVVLYMIGHERNAGHWPVLHGIIWVSLGTLIPAAILLSIGAWSLISFFMWISS